MAEPTQQVRQKMHAVSELFNSNKYEQALQEINSIDTTQVDSKFQHKVLMNRAAIYMAMQKYPEAVGQYQLLRESKGEQLSPEFYSNYIGALIKAGLDDQAQETSQEARQLYPQHRKIKELARISQDNLIVNNEDKYLEKMFEKLCEHPQVREYLKQESFLTKVERLIRNPSLGPALEKIDPRIKEAADAMLMAAQEQQQ